MYKRLTVYLYCSFWVGIAFFSVYPSANWLTAHRTNQFNLYFIDELRIPFLPEFVWVYLSMYLLFLTPPFFLTADELPVLRKQLIAGTFISGAVFLLFPAHLGFDRIVPNTPVYDWLFAGIFSIDQPHNLVPSLHVVFSASIIMAILNKAKGWVYGLYMIWLIAIVMSTLLIHQHHILDVLSGLTLTIILHNFYRDTPCSNR